MMPSGSKNAQQFLKCISIFLKQQIIDSSKLKEFAVDNFKSDENGEKFSSREKEKMFIMSNFSFSDSVFKRLVLQTCKNKGLFGKGLNTNHTFHKDENVCENEKLLMVF